MTTYTITADERSHIPGRDAYAVTVRVHHGDEDLGLFQTWISGIADSEIDRFRRPAITKLQRRRIAAELLADEIAMSANDGSLRTAWEEQVEVIPIDPRSIVARAAESLRPYPDFRAGDLIATFEAR